MTTWGQMAAIYDWDEHGNIICLDDRFYGFPGHYQPIFSEHFTRDQAKSSCLAVCDADTRSQATLYVGLDNSSVSLAAGNTVTHTVKGDVWKVRFPAGGSQLVIQRACDNLNFVVPLEKATPPAPAAPGRKRKYPSEKKKREKMTKALKDLKLPALKDHPQQDATVEGQQCSICLTHKVDTLLKPCLHARTCLECVHNDWNRQNQERKAHFLCSHCREPVNKVECIKL